MTTKLRIVVASIAMCLVCFAANAQTHGGAPSVRISPVRVAPGIRPGVASPGYHSTGFTPSRPGSPPVRVMRTSPGGRVSSGTFSAADSSGFENEFSGSDVPGLGFDYTDLAVFNRALNNPNNGSFGFRHHQHSGGESFFPLIWWGGYPLYSDESGYEQPEQQTQQQPQVIVIQQPVPAQQIAESESESSNSAARASAPQATEPVTDVGEFVLVRKDGRVLFASIYQVVGAQIQYVTPEGTRRSLPLSDLDADATQQMNEARGTTVEIHN